MSVGIEVMAEIRGPHLLFLMASGKGLGLARKASAVWNIIVTGRPSLARKVAVLEAAEAIVRNDP